jgi:hypothetical protein
VDEVAKEDGTVQRALLYARASDDELHYVLSAGDDSEAGVQATVQRQARALSLATRNLERLAKVALADVQGRALLEANLHKLCESAKDFQARAGQLKELKTWREAFGPVNQAWEQVVGGLRTLPPGRGVFLMRSATRVDQLHERVHRALGIPGERPRLTIRT